MQFKNQKKDIDWPVRYHNLQESLRGLIPHLQRNNLKIPKELSPNMYFNHTHEYVAASNHLNIDLKTTQEEIMALIKLLKENIEPKSINDDLTCSMCYILCQRLVEEAQTFCDNLQIVIVCEIHEKIARLMEIGKFDLALEKMKKDQNVINCMFQYGLYFKLSISSKHIAMLTYLLSIASQEHFKELQPIITNCAYESTFTKEMDMLLEPFKVVDKTLKSQRCIYIQTFEQWPLEIGTIITSYDILDDSERISFLLPISNSEKSICDNVNIFWNIGGKSKRCAKKRYFLRAAGIQSKEISMDMLVHTINYTTYIDYFRSSDKNLKMFFIMRFGDISTEFHKFLKKFAKKLYKI